jgi:hypothetical protein
MKIEAVVILTVILALSGALEAQGTPNGVVQKPRYGIVTALGGSPIDELGKEEGNWNAYAGVLAGGFVRLPVNPWLEAQFEGQYLTRGSFRSFPHPQPYVFEMDTDVRTRLLRLPVSLILAKHQDYHKAAVYLGGGISAGFPLKAELIRELHYNTEWVTTTTDIRDQFAKPVVGAQAMLGLRYTYHFIEARFGRDLTSFTAPGLDLNGLVPWEFWCVFGLATK